MSATLAFRSTRSTRPRPAAGGLVWATAVPVIVLHDLGVGLSAINLLLPAPADEPAAATGGLTAVPRQPLSLAWFSRLITAITVGDAAAIVFSLLAASFVRFGNVAGWLPGTTAAYALATGAVAVVWLSALSATKSRAKRIIGEGLTEYQRVTNATVLAFGATAIVCYLGQIEFARGFFAVAMPLGWLLLLVNRLAWRKILVRMRRNGRCVTGAMVVGSWADVDRTVTELRRNISAGYRPVAIALTEPFASAPDAVRRRLAAIPRIPIGSVVAAVKHSRVRALMIAGDLPGGRERIRSLGWALENSNAELILVSSLTDVAGPRIHLRPVVGLPMVHVQLPQYSGFAHSVKRVFDVVAAVGGLVVFAPLFGLITLIVRADGGPALFRQERVGVGGTTFRMLKFRSMVVDAEVRRAALADDDEGNGVMFKMRRDPRVTSAGRILRRFSLDELPQLWNVLRGDMSMVGPRPPLASEVDNYASHETRRLLSKPGLTGLWQVSGRSDLSWEESVRLDLYYVENWSFTGDLILVLRTIIQVFKPHGAY